jgi:hypothetical protein
VSRIEWPQVASDFIKIGLPALCTAAVALFGFWFTRSHELEKDQRRRRQDALERISDDFQAACFNLATLARDYSVYRDSGGTNFQELFKTDDAIDAATKDLHVIGGRLKLLQLTKCDEAFGGFLYQTIAFRKILTLPPEPLATAEAVRQEFGKVQALRITVERLLGEAFNSL